MAFQVSPGTNITEKDASTTVAAVSTTDAGIAGVFRWGPIGVITPVDQESTLVRKFGKPSDLNPETWFTAANFTGYGTNLNVVRAAETANANTTLNVVTAYSNTGTVSSVPAVKNIDDFRATTLDANVSYLGRYPSALGNSLKISQCDSANAFSSTLSVSDVGVTNTSIAFSIGSNTAVITILGANVATVNTAANNLLAQVSVGDIFTTGNSTIGKINLKVASIGAVTANATTSTANIGFTSAYNLGTAYAANTVVRSWEFASLFDKAPTTSNYSRNLGLSTIDEVHLVVIDEDGLFTSAPNTVLETWSNLSRATDAKGENGQTIYYKNVINNSSEYVYVGADRSGAASANATAITNSSNVKPATVSLANGSDGATEKTIPLGALAIAYDKFKNSEDVDISVIMQGKARGSSADSDTTPSASGVNYSGLANYLLSNLADTRKDLVVCTSPAYPDVVSTTDKVTAVTQYVTNINYASSYGIMDSGYKYQYDKYNDVYRWIPLNGDTAGTLVRTDTVADPWFSPAGAARGQIKNVTKLAFNPTQAERDTLYKVGVNPVIIKKGSGAILYGDKTLLGRPSSFDRINVRRLFIVLEKAIANAAESSLFEFNDVFTRNRFVSIVEPFLRDVQGRRGIYDFRVVCDETNNTAQVIDSNSFVGDIYVKPAKSTNFIQLNFVAVSSGVEFSEIVGQV